jgi:hypothetical protein
MDDHLQGKYWGARGANARGQKRAREREGAPPADPNHCTHLWDTVKRIEPSGRYGFRDVCSLCDADGDWHTESAANRLRVERMRVERVGPTRPDPSLEGVTCCIRGCGRPATLWHHPLPVHRFGQARADALGVAPYCAEHHQIVHEAWAS